MAAVAGCRQLPDQASELIQALGVASLLGQFRGTRSALIEIQKIWPDIWRRICIGRRIAIGAWFPLVGSRRKPVRKRHQHDRDRVGVLPRLCGVELVKIPCSLIKARDVTPRYLPSS
jgi:hypothetical protein